jgi:hypothetical protein
MRFTLRRAGGPRGMSWTARAVVAAVLVTGNGVAGFSVAKVVAGC